MKYTVPSSQDLQEVKELILKMLQIIEPGYEPASVGNSSRWVKSAEMKKILNCSSGTLQNLRVKGDLHYRKIGGTIYYSMDSLNKLLNNH